jgi:hypothetical protein
MSDADENACKVGWKNCDDVLRYESPSLPSTDMITKLQIAMFHNNKKGALAFSTKLFESITGHADSNPGMLVGISELLMFALPSDVENSLSIAMKLMTGRVRAKHNCDRCTGTVTCRIDDFATSKKICFTYENEDGVKRDLVAHFTMNRDKFVFIMAFSSDD